METRFLAGGQIHQWSTLHELGDVTYMWQDIDGLHIDSLPLKPPLTSLLHGWSSDGTNLIRIRTDGERSYVAVLTNADTSSKPAGLRNEGQVQVIAHETIPWGGDKRVSQLDRQLAKTRFVTYETVGIDEGGMLFLHGQQVGGSGDD